MFVYPSESLAGIRIGQTSMHSSIISAIMIGTTRSTHVELTRGYLSPLSWLIVVFPPNEALTFESYILIVAHTKTSSTSFATVICSFVLNAMDATLPTPPVRLFFWLMLSKMHIWLWLIWTIGIPIHHYRFRRWGDALHVNEVLPEGGLARRCDCNLLRWRFLLAA